MPPQKTKHGRSRPTFVIQEPKRVTSRPTFVIQKPKRVMSRPAFVIVPQSMTGQEAAIYLGLNYYDLMRRSAAGEIPRVKWGESGRNVRFRKADLDAWLAELPLAEGAVRPKPGTRREPEPAA